MAKANPAARRSASTQKVVYAVRKPKFKVGEEVHIIAGKSKGQRGAVLQIDRKRGYVVVKEVNMIKRHTKARQAGQKGEIIQKEAPLHISNVKAVKQN